MSIEQTNQLIQLILNTLLLGVMSAGMVAVTSMRVQWVVLHLQGMQELLQVQERPIHLHHLAYLSQKRRSLRRHYRLERLGQLAAHHSFLLAILSALVVSMRSFVNWNELIPISLICFVGSLALLLASAMCVLLALHQFPKALAAPNASTTDGRSHPLKRKERSPSASTSALNVL